MSDIFAKYIQDWMPKDNALLPYYVGIDEFLEEYLQSNEHDYEKLQPKIIADPLLGYIHVTRLEIAIIDTKLFQRLRKISQLGLANLVFPSLGYSRFEHSLGVLGRLNQVLNKLIENYSRLRTDNLLKSTIDEFATSIRISALMHDVGHCIFSHCSERVLEKVKGENGYPDAATIQSVISEHFKKEKRIPFAEIFSISIIGSRRFQKFIEDFSLYNTKDSKRILEHAGRFILGLPVNDKPETLFLAQLISSGLDVDKIDYMVREQHYSGIKLEIDLDRILSKLNVFTVKSYELPKNLEHQKKFFAPDVSYQVLGFEKGGQFAFEEFCIARLALHVKIYLHQKVRAAESQLSKYLENIIENPTLKEVHNWLRLTEYIIQVPQAMHYNFSSSGSLFQFALTSEQAESFLNIHNRKIYYRAFSFGPMNSYSEGSGDDNLESKIKKLEAYFDQFLGIDLKDLIINKAQEICEEFDIEINFSLFKEIVIEFPRLLNIQQGQESLFFERANWLPLKWTIPIDKILIYFQENRALAYIFAPKEIAHVIAVASEITLFKISEKVFSQEANISKNTFKEFVFLKDTLNNKAFYTQYPQLKPVSEYLQKAEASEKIKEIQEKLASFKSLNDEYVTINKITTFVNQFPLYLQEACLTFLKYIEIYSENLLKEELEKTIQKINSSDKKIGVTYLGSVADSGGHLAYYLRPVLERHEIEPLEFNDNLVIENEKIIFYDDNINSGLQLINIFAEMVDEKDKLESKYNLNEKHHKKLANQAAREKFKAMPKYVVYIVGTEDAIVNVREALTPLGFNVDNIFISIRKVLTKDEKIFSGTESIFNHTQKKELRDYFAEIGEKLLRAENKSDEKIESCKLGYANSEALVFFPYNIPTMTITALWCRGDNDGIPWIPLAERRRRSTKGGKYLGED